jgi:sulfatase maturation enzyme AslB (radical SAM superfamily)
VNTQEQASPQGRSIDRMIKLSKLCKLMCAYCYQWNELGDARRMSADLIERVVRAAADLHRLRLKSTPAVRTTLIMHGGEPLVLHLDYLRSSLIRDLLTTRGAATYGLERALIYGILFHQHQDAISA